MLIFVGQTLFDLKHIRETRLNAGQPQSNNWWRFTMVTVVDLEANEALENTSGS